MKPRALMAVSCRASQPLFQNAWDETDVALVSLIVIVQQSSSFVLLSLSFDGKERLSLPGLTRSKVWQIRVCGLLNHSHTSRLLSRVLVFYHRGSRQATAKWDLVGGRKVQYVCRLARGFARQVIVRKSLIVLQVYF